MSQTTLKVGDYALTLWHGDPVYNDEAPLDEVPAHVRAEMAHRLLSVPVVRCTPWDVVSEYLEHLGLSPEDLAREVSPEFVDALRAGAHGVVGPEQSETLARVLGRPAHFWQRLQQRYDGHEESSDQTGASREWRFEGGAWCMRVGKFELSVKVVGDYAVWAVSLVDKRGTYEVAAGVEHKHPAGDVFAAKRSCEEAAREAGISVPMPPGSGVFGAPMNFRP
jgi:plasmid maintenance system antidote protein VapI